MSIIQFLRIFWARRWIIAAATISCVVGGVIVGLVLPPRWEAHSRVLLDLDRPDSQTGQRVTDSRDYASTQLSLIKDYAVAGRVADELGWLSDPALIQQYQHRDKGDTRDFRRWIAQRVIEGTKASLVVPDAMGMPSDIIDIGYTATTPKAAQAVADALRTAYIDARLDFTRQAASQNADWYSTQAQQAKAALDAATTSMTSYEKQSGIVLQDNKLDVDSNRLQSLSAQGIVAPAAVISAQQNPEYSSLSLQLGQIDAAISEDSKTLGPNHPELQELRAKRATVAAALARQHPTLGGGSATVDIGAVDRALSAQTSKVIGEGDKIAKLKQLQAEVELRRAQYDKTTATAAELRQESGATDIGLTPLGPAVVPNIPKFPNWSLIIPGSLGLGLAVGLMVALLAELFARRVRGPEDLQSAVDAPLLAIVEYPAWVGVRRLSPEWPPGGGRPGRRKLIKA